MTVSLARAAIWLPPDFEDAAQISTASGVPETVVREKLGIVRKCRAGRDTHPSVMAIRAARKVLRDIDPDSVKLVIWTGSEYKDFPVWTAAVYVQEQLGLRRAWAFDAAARCSSNLLGLRLARALMETDPSLDRVLLCGGHRTGDLVNYRDSSARFLYNLSDGGSAMLLERGESNPVLESAFITDGSFSEDVILQAGGTRYPVRAGVDPERTYLRAPRIADMRERLGERSIGNFTKVILEAAGASLSRPIDYLALLHMKRSAHDAILAELGLRQDQSIYLDHYGHFGAPDQVLSLGLAEQRGLLGPGHHVVLASAGIGYIWSAISLRWDRPTFLDGDLY